MACTSVKHKNADFDENELFQDRWLMKYKISEGGFGVIWAAEDAQTKVKVAVKVERKKAKRPLLRMELLVFSRLKGYKDDVIALLDSGESSCGLRYVVMERVGPNLSHLRRSTPFHRFDLGTSVRAARQMLECVRQLHTIGCIHRDVKPSNFCIGLTKDTVCKIYIIDFGLARQYVNDEGRVRNPRHPAPYRGTMTYASIYAMQKLEQERRDDLISLFYVLVEMMRGDLPWRIHSDEINKVDLKQWVLKVKLQSKKSPSIFLQGLPYELYKLHKYLFNLNYGDDPNYDFMQKLLLSIEVDNGIKDTDKFAWQSFDSHFYDEANTLKKSTAQTHSHLSITGHEPAPPV